MSSITIMRRESLGGGVLHAAEAGSICAAVEQLARGGADLSGAYLAGANLSGANLSGADLRGAYLIGADLSGADMSGAYLAGANLRGAYLRGANLIGADLRGAYLIGADLSGADLSGARLAWGSHALLSHVLKVAAGDDLPRRMVAGLVAVSTDWCWDRLLGLPVDPDTRAWALDTLAACIVEGDDSPDALRQWRQSRAQEVAS